MLARGSLSAVVVGDVIGDVVMYSVTFDSRAVTQA